LWCGTPWSQAKQCKPKKGNNKDLWLQVSAEQKTSAADLGQVDFVAVVVVAVSWLSISE
jgi:hypothetical protein